MIALADTAVIASVEDALLLVTVHTGADAKADAKVRVQAVAPVPVVTTPLVSVPLTVGVPVPQDDGDGAEPVDARWTEHENVLPLTAHFCELLMSKLTDDVAFATHVVEPHE